MTHVMVDLETMGSAAGCPIISIGAVVFDPRSGVQDITFYRNVSLKSCMIAGLKADADTIMWWMEQSDSARAALRGAAGGLSEALDAFSDWFRATRAEFFWCHGATFDAPILEAAYRAIGKVAPWKFWNVRDTRTLYDLAGVQPDRAKGVYHNALDDAKNQAEAAVRAYAKLFPQKEDVFA